MVGWIVSGKPIIYYVLWTGTNQARPVDIHTPLGGATALLQSLLVLDTNSGLLFIHHAFDLCAQCAGPNRSSIEAN